MLLRSIPVYGLNLIPLILTEALLLDYIFERLGFDRGVKRRRDCVWKVSETKRNIPLGKGDVAEAKVYLFCRSGGGGEVERFKRHSWKVQCYGSSLTRYALHDDRSFVQVHDEFDD